MAEVASLAEWKKATYSLTRMHSDFLKVVDAAARRPARLPFRLAYARPNCLCFSSLTYSTRR